MEEIRRKKNIKRFLGIGILSAFLTLFFAQAVFAATTISAVNITLDIDLEAEEPLPNLACGYTGDDCEVMVSDNSRYDIRTAKWVNKPDEAKLGVSYILEIYVEALDDYRFSGSYSSYNVNVKGGTLVSVSRLDRDEILVRVKSRPAKGEFDPPEDVYWLDASGNSAWGQARWSHVEEAAYDLYLYRNGKLVHKETGVQGNSFNFYPYMTAKGTYTFRVRAVAKNEEISRYAKSSDWALSGEVYIGEEHVSDGSVPTAETETASTPLPPSDTSAVGWLQSSDYWYYRYPDGSYLRDCWASLGGKWYMFDSNGAMLTGWQNRNGNTYYLAESGEMITGWVQYENHWYYLNPGTDLGVQGAMLTGWIQVDGKDYYLNPDGSMAEGWQEVEGSWYYFYPGSGAKAVNTQIGDFSVDQYGVWHKPEASGY